MYICVKRYYLDIISTCSCDHPKRSACFLFWFCGFFCGQATFKIDHMSFGFLSLQKTALFLCPCRLPPFASQQRDLLLNRKMSLYTLPKQRIKSIKHHAEKGSHDPQELWTTGWRLAVSSTPRHYTEAPAKGPSHDAAIIPLESGLHIRSQEVFDKHWTNYWFVKSHLCIIWRPPNAFCLAVLWSMLAGKCKAGKGFAFKRVSVGSNSWKI